MRALIVVDVQNEFSARGLRPVPNHGAVLDRIHAHVEHARQKGWPIAWVRLYNKPHESSAFVPGTWGAEFYPGIAVPMCDQLRTGRSWSLQRVVDDSRWFLG